MKRTALVGAAASVLALIVPGAALGGTPPPDRPTKAEVRRWNRALWDAAVFRNAWHAYVANAWEVIDEELDAQAAATRRSTRLSPPMANTGTGDCYDGAPVPASIIDRESGGNPYIVNPSSGAYGCYQLMPMHYNGGVCSDLDRSVEGQKACASRLPPSAWGM